VCAHKAFIFTSSLCNKQAKIDRLQEVKINLKMRVEELKYAGPGGRSGARKLVDELEEQLTANTAKLDQCRQKYERLQRVLIDGLKGGRTDGRTE